MKPGDTIYVEPPKTGGSDTALLVDNSDDEEIVVVLNQYVRRIPRHWVFNPEAVNVDAWCLVVDRNSPVPSVAGRSVSFYETPEEAFKYALDVCDSSVVVGIDVWSSEGHLVASYEGEAGRWRFFRVTA